MCGIHDYSTLIIFYQFWRIFLNYLIHSEYYAMIQMMKRTHVVISIISVALFAFLLFSTEEKSVRVPILVYHDVRPEKAVQNVEKLSMTPEEFERQLTYLKEAGFRTVTLDALIRAVEYGAGLPNKPIILTFDDSWRGQYEYVLPLLKKYGFHGTFFISSGFVERDEFLSWEDIKEMTNEGMEIGGHGKAHLDLTEISDEKLLRQEIVEDKNEIEKQLGKKIYHFAYSFGNYNENVISAVKSAGYLSARGTKIEADHSLEDLFNLNAYVITGDFKKFLKTVDLVN